MNSIERDILKERLLNDRKKLVSCRDYIKAQFEKKVQKSAELIVSKEKKIDRK